MISLLIPSRGRPEGCRQAILSALDTAHGAVRVLVYVPEDDPTLPEYARLHGLATVFVGKQQPTSASWNILAGFEQKADLLMLAADDMLFKDESGWDMVLQAAAAPYAETPHVFHFQDSRNPLNTPNPIMTRAWLELFGWFVPPQFYHWYVDTFTCWVAKLAGVFTEVHTVKLLSEQQPPNAFPWCGEWLRHDRAEWVRSAPAIEQAMARVMRATGR